MVLDCPYPKKWRTLRIPYIHHERQFPKVTDALWPFHELFIPVSLHCNGLPGVLWNSLYYSLFSRFRRWTKNPHWKGDHVTRHENQSKSSQMSSTWSSPKGWSGFTMGLSRADVRVVASKTLKSKKFLLLWEKIMMIQLKYERAESNFANKEKRRKIE